MSQLKQRKISQQQALSPFEFSTTEQDKVSLESQFDGLASSFRYFRAQTIAFILFSVTLILLVTGITGKEFFMETPIVVPLWGIQLPLTSFFTMMPVGLLVWHFLLLFQQKLLKKRVEEYLTQAESGLVEHQHKGFYEEMLLQTWQYKEFRKKYTWYQKIIPSAMLLMKVWMLQAIIALIYVFLPLLTLFWIWVQFADYQDLDITRLHLAFLAIDLVLLLFYLANMKAFTTKIDFLFRPFLYPSFVFLGWLVFMLTVYLYEPLLKKDNSVEHIAKLNQMLNMNKGSNSYRLKDFFKPYQLKEFFKPYRLKEFFKPYIDAQGEVLTNLTANDQRVLAISKEGLPLTVQDFPITDYSNRHFRFANLTSSQLPNVKLQKSYLDFAILDEVNLNFVQAEGASIQHASLWSAQLKNSSLNNVVFNHASLWNIDLTRAYLHDASLYKTDLQLAYIIKNNKNEYLTDKTKLNPLGEENLKGVKELTTAKFSTAEEVKKAQSEYRNNSRRKIRLLKLKKQAEEKRKQALADAMTDERAARLAEQALPRVLEMLQKKQGNDFVKLSAKGTEFTEKDSNWSCVKDNNSNLYWEVKTQDGGIRDYRKEYRWGGKTKSKLAYEFADLDVTTQVANYTKGKFYDDWNSLVDAANRENLCGFSDWRVPTIFELQTLSSYYATGNKSQANNWPAKNSYTKKVYLNPSFFPTISLLKFP